MIKLNGEIIKQEHFPDNSLRIDTVNNSNICDCLWYCSVDPLTITWYYENDAELFTIICLRKHFPNKGMILEMPYCPHARMDRVKKHTDFFTLRHFADIINYLNFNFVSVLDPHSYVSEALINNIVVQSPEDYIIQAGVKCNPDLIFFPDEGAMKRYSNLLRAEYAFGIKRRDWETGQILGLDVAGNIDKIKDSKILIVDDICSRGGTFYHSAKKLKELGAKEIYLYITHCENTIFEGELLTSGLIERVYTTNSIFTKEHEKIEVFEL